ncbi:MAG: YdcF family protein [Chloracidobacterium sp.]|nr:YdcF family protein [Chloracidobacterium sp.]MDW8216703.1 ElyC/SanA/YdcF family protein [Acidobacteriota bacterium]
MKRKPSWVWWQRATLALVVSPPLLVALTNVWVVASTWGRVFKRPDHIPANNVGLVLGTAKYLATGGINPHFQNRIRAAADLYHAGKIKHLILSGSNQTLAYDEPTEMRKSLRHLGVPDGAMTADYAGRRTLDSVVRARDIFGQTRFTVISDEFHVYRALFLCDRFGVTAVAYGAPDPPWSVSARTRLREYAARCKAVLDVYILGTQPRFRGEPIALPVTSEATTATAPAVLK